MRAEMEMAMKLLEKDVHEKQDTIISLRDQLEDIKIINMEMYSKLQVIFFGRGVQYIICLFKGDFPLFVISLSNTHLSVFSKLFSRNIRIYIWWTIYVFSSSFYPN